MHIIEAYFVYQVGDLRRREKERVGSVRVVVKGECEMCEVYKKKKYEKSEIIDSRLER